MIINKTSYMRTFSEFCKELSETFPYADFNFKNWTAQDHCGWTESLYEAQDGVIGEGDTLKSAIADHKVKYGEHLRTEE